MSDATPYRLRSLRWWLADRILGPHGRILRRVTHDEFAVLLARSSEGSLTGEEEQAYCQTSSKVPPND